MVQPKPGCNGVTLRVQIRGEHLGATAGRQSGVHESDGSLPDDQNRFVCSQVEHLYTLQHGVYGLNEGRLLKGHIIGDAHHAAAGRDPVHHPDVFCEAAAEGSKPAVTPTFL